MKMNELKDLELKDLLEKVENAEEKLQQMKLNHSIAPLENPTQIKAVSLDIARMKTELRQRELNK